MVKGFVTMMIGAFAQATGLSADTIRFYVRRGLLTPETGPKGGANPYQIFTHDHVKAARMIRMGQSLGMPLKEIALLNAEYRAGGMTRERSVAVMAGQLAKLQAQTAELETMTRYLRDKLTWLEAGAVGDEPDFPLHGWTGEPCAQGGLTDRQPMRSGSPARKG